MEETGPKVSIIVPVYGAAKYLPKCIESLMGQTYQNLEIILIDDGSTDGSDKIVDEYAKKDKRIKVVHQENGGQSAARNRGLKIASGDFIGFVDDDDEVSPEFVEELLGGFRPETAMTVCGMHRKFLKDGKTEDIYVNPLRVCKKHETKKAYILYLMTVDGRLYSSVNKLYRVEYAKKCAFDEKINFAEDTKFVLDYIKIASGVPTFVLKPLYIYNYGTENSTIKTTAVDWNNWKASYKDLKNWLGPNATLRERFWLRAVKLRWKVSYRKRRAGN